MIARRRESSPCRPYPPPRCVNRSVRTHAAKVAGTRVEPWAGVQGSEREVVGGDRWWSDHERGRPDLRRCRGGGDGWPADRERCRRVDDRCWVLRDRWPLITSGVGVIATGVPLIASGVGLIATGVPLIASGVAIVGRCAPKLLFQGVWGVWYGAVTFHKGGSSHGEVRRRHSTWIEGA